MAAAKYHLRMPWGLKRFQQTGPVHYPTFSCYWRRPNLKRYVRESNFCHHAGLLTPKQKQQVPPLRRRVRSGSDRNDKEEGVPHRWCRLA